MTFIKRRTPTRQIDGWPFPESVVDGQLVKNVPPEAPEPNPDLLWPFEATRDEDPFEGLHSPPF